MSGIIRYVFSAGGFACAALVGIVWVAFEPDSSAARTALVGTVLAYGAASVYAAPAAVCSWMNGGSPRIPLNVGAATDRTALVLLSGRVDTVRGSDGREIRVLSRSCAARVLEAARVYDAISPEWVISTGGLPNPASRGRPAADVMRDALIQLGVPAARIVVECTSRSTHDEAINVVAMLQRLGAARAVLVTSDVHMPRSLAAFRGQGYSPLPAPARDPDRAGTWSTWIIPSGQGLRFSADVAHEILGSVYYRVRGWSRPPPSSTP